MNEILTTIRGRGYWHVVVHPAQFSAKALSPITTLEEHVRRSSVELRGWAFPHVGTAQPQIGMDYIEKSVQYAEHLEFWRFYQSAQFVFFGGFYTDWSERGPAQRRDFGGGKVLGVADTLYRMIEIFEYAGRLASRCDEFQSWRVNITANGLSNRILYLEDRMRAPFSVEHKCTLESFPQSFDLPRAQVLAEALTLGKAAAKELYNRFNWMPHDSVLDSMVADVQKFWSRF